MLGAKAAQMHMNRGRPYSQYIGAHGNTCFYIEHSGFIQPANDLFLLAFSGDIRIIHDSLLSFPNGLGQDSVVVLIHAGGKKSLANYHILGNSEKLDDF